MFKTSATRVDETPVDRAQLTRRSAVKPGRDGRLASPRDRSTAVGGATLRAVCKSRYRHTELDKVRKIRKRIVDYGHHADDIIASIWVMFNSGRPDEASVAICDLQIGRVLPDTIKNCC